MIGRTQGQLAATACVLIFGACSDPEERSDLRPSGAPEVLTVLVSNDANGVNELATFCKLNDNKRPGLVPAAITAGSESQVCPDDLAKGADEVEDAVPLSWYVRVQFDELLNPDIEELIPIADSELKRGSLAMTQPVVLSCGGVAVAYDGYYNPSGNNITFPLGPSLFIAPTGDAITTIPTGSDCTIALKADVIVDKDGEHVPAAQVGPYSFKIAPMALLAADPAIPKVVEEVTVPTKVAPEDPVVLSFNAQVDIASLDPALVQIHEVTACADTGGTVHTAVIGPVPKDPTSVAISIADAPTPDDHAFNEKTTYVVTFAAGAKVTQDIAPGGEVDLTKASAVKKPLCFVTNAFAPPK